MITPLEFTPNPFQSLTTALNRANYHMEQLIFG
jgi:hypothetical protein